MNFPAFEIGQLPRILFGTGYRAQIPAVVAKFGQRVLIITGNNSFRHSTHWDKLTAVLKQRHINWQDATIGEEPSPTLVDTLVDQYRGWQPQAVLAIGGGSVLDGAKAIADLLLHNNSVMDHLEGVGRNIPYNGPAVPCIAVPTTAGTGSEATKNSVLSLRGPNGYKKSFRHDLLVPAVAIVDPDLLASCPQDLIAAQGMDAFTQLLESYVSIRANPLTDALAWSGLEAFHNGFWGTWRGEAACRPQMAYAALVSGICLAQTGLGIVHGCAAPLGAFFPIPHGVVCATLIAEATAINIRALQERAPTHPAVAKYAKVGALLRAHNNAITDSTSDLNALISTLRDWEQRLDTRLLGSYGMTAIDIPRVVAQSNGNSMKTNPLILTTIELTELLMRRL